ncbi:MAG: Na+/H+ antiporter NhaC [Bacteroidales bacterium]|jgi:NhaC family Na+:H+ antiporter|nr:Na+/H+ antiporter NhaC [Bacteroidales bacterium]
MTKSIKNPTLLQSLFPLVFLITFLVLNVKYFGDHTLDGANQIALILAATIAGIISVNLGHKWLDVRAKVVQSIGSAMPSILILFLIGSLAGTWMISGVVPMLIYYGLQILNPKIFLFATVVICSVVSLATGSSWSTVATIGVALLGIGVTLGIKEGIVAGAIISGAYFGDKMSPLSDTTNLAPAMAGTDLFTHIRYMVLTTAPTMTITLIIFLVIGFSYNFGGTPANVENVLTSIRETFYISPVLLLVPALLIFVIAMKVPPLPSLIFGTLAGAVCAIIFQPHIVSEIVASNGSFFKNTYIGVMKAMFGAVSVTTDNDTVNELLTTGGMAGMLNTIWLIISAMVFGGIMEAAGMLAKITQYIMKMVHNAGSLVGSTVATCLFFNVTASDQYLSIVVPGRMFSKMYRDMGFKPELLSRSLEDSGTVTSVLIPWNTCGATQSKVLGVSVWSYAPYAFFNIISPFMSVFMAAFNIKIKRFSDDPTPEHPLDLEERKDV